MRVVLPLAVLLFLLPQDSLDKKVAALLDQMRADDIERRDAAAKELFALGEPARELLLKAAAKAEDAEFAVRVKAVAERIRRASLRGDAPDRLKKRSLRMAEAFSGKGAEDAVLSALGWLARHQEADGGWSTAVGKKFAGDPCAGAGSGVNDDGLTALAVLSFLGAGYDPSAKDELVDPFDRRKWKPGEVAKKGLERLALRQRKDGGVIGEEKPMYGHALATLAFCEAWAMTGEPSHRDSARRAVDYLLEARNPGAAWRYTSRSGDSDTSVTGWCVAALDAAVKSGLWDVDAPVRDSIVNWMDKVAAPGSVKAGYNKAGTGKVFVPGKNDHFTHHETMTAISVLARRILAPETEDPAALKGGLALLVKDLPDKGDGIDCYYWFWGSTALRRIDGADGASWVKWAEALRATSLPLQSEKGCSHGSWDDVVDRWGFEGGRIGVTALNALTLLAPAR